MERWKRLSQGEIFLFFGQILASSIIDTSLLWHPQTSQKSLGYIFGYKAPIALRCFLNRFEHWRSCVQTRVGTVFRSVPHPEGKQTETMIFAARLGLCHKEHKSRTSDILTSPTPTLHNKRGLPWMFQIESHLNGTTPSYFDK